MITPISDILIINLKLKKRNMFQLLLLWLDQPVLIYLKTHDNREKFNSVFHGFVEFSYNAFLSRQHDKAADDKYYSKI